MDESLKFTMSSSPHVTSKDSTRRIMTDVCIALMPALAVGTYLFGVYALFLVFLSVVTCVTAEYVYNLLRKRQQTIGDRSAIVTGLLLGLNLPPVAPFYVPIIGGIFAIIIVKMLFGGIGKNFANPALAARIFLFLTWTVMMNRFIQPLGPTVGFSGMFNFSTMLTDADVVTSATPLSGGNASLWHLFIGYTAGCIGETSDLALLIGGIYLAVRRVIDVRIPLIIWFTTAVFTYVFGAELNQILPMMFSGGLTLCAVYMATDYATSPNTFWGIVIFAVLIGFLTALLRMKSEMTEGVSFAILLANLVVPLLDRHIIPRPFGNRFKEKEAK